MKNVTTKVLIVDDAQSQRTLCSLFLSARCGCQCLEASCTREALRILKTSQVDLIISDIVRGDSQTISGSFFSKLRCFFDNWLYTLRFGAMDDGITFYRYLKSCKKYRSIPVIIISGNADTFSDFCQEVLGFGDCAMTKPFDIFCLKKIVETLQTTGKLHEP